MGSSYRTVMEVLKWVESKETLSAAALVNTCFLTVSDSDELWYSYIDLLGGEVATLSQTVLTTKERYRQLHKRNLILHGNFFVSSCGNELIYQKCPIPWTIDCFSVAAFLTPTELFVCRGSGSSEVYTLNIETGAVRPLSPMLCSRSYHSVIFLQDKMYAFGGSGIKTAEKYTVSEGRWTKLPKMINEHSSFNVCSEGDLVYLCGGHTVHCESFNYKTEVYTPLPCQLGAENWTIAFIHERELIAFVDSKFYYVNSEEKKVKEGSLPLIP